MLKVLTPCSSCAEVAANKSGINLAILRNFSLNDIMIPRAASSLSDRSFSGDLQQLVFCGLLLHGRF